MNSRQLESRRGRRKCHVRVVALLLCVVASLASGQYDQTGGGIQWEVDAGGPYVQRDWPGLTLEVIGYQPFAWTIDGNGWKQRVTAGAYVLDENTVPAMFPRWRAYWKYATVKHDAYLLLEHWKTSGTGTANIGSPYMQVGLGDDSKWFVGTEDPFYHTDNWPSIDSTGLGGANGRDWHDPVTGYRTVPPDLWFETAARIGIRWTPWAVGDGWDVEFNLRWRLEENIGGDPESMAWRDGGADQWVKAYDVRISAWDGEYPGGAGSVDDAFEEEIYNAVVNFHGDFLEWQTDNNYGWQRAMFQTGISKTPYLLQIQDYLSGAKNSVLKTANGSTIQRLEDIDNNTDGLEAELTDVGLTLDGILSAVTADGTLDTGEFTGPEPGPTYLGTNINQHLVHPGWGFFQPVGSDYVTPPVWVIDVPVSTWFAGSQFSSAGLEEVSFTIDTSIFAPMRTMLQTIWLAGIWLWSLGRIWAELRKT